LKQEKGAVFPDGARIEIDSDIPVGKGVASSAALEVATMTAVAEAYALELEPREVALLSQKVENAVVGAPCGVMDQMTAVFGENDRLLALLCQPAEIEGNLPIPEELAFFGIDSGVAHEVSGVDYGAVRVGTFMGYRMLQAWAGTAWGGYLANLPPSELEGSYLARLPEAIRGRDFLDRFGATGDEATVVDPDRSYPVRRPTAHPVHEHFRTRAFARLLGTRGSGPLLGELMYQSHASYSACGLGSRGTDRLVELARAFGPSRGIHGAKITGGGSGGTVAFLAARDAEASVREIARRYGEETGFEPYLFIGSSRLPGGT
jgi:L-arabinokinase